MINFAFARPTLRYKLLLPDRDRLFCGEKLFGSAAYRPKINESVSNLISFSDARDQTGAIVQEGCWPRRKDTA